MMTEDPSPTPELKPEGAGDSFVPKDVLFLPAEETGVAHESVKALKEETSRKPARKRKTARRKAAGLASVEGGSHNPREGLLNVAIELFAAHGYDAVSRSEEHTSELQSLMRISYAVLCLKKKKQ